MKVKEHEGKQSVSLVENASGLENLLTEKRDSIAKMLPNKISPDRVIKMAMVAATKQPKLYQCTKLSLMQSLMDSAELGLNISGQLGSGYLIPYYNKKIQNYEATFVPGYRGLVDLARRSGQIKNIETHLVYEKDEFVVEYGLEPKLIHKPLIAIDRGEVICVYSIARLSDGEKQIEMMTTDQINDIRDRSKANRSGPWKTDWSEMARKTVLRRLVKYLPLSVESQTQLAKATEIEDKRFGLPEISNDPPKKELEEGKTSFGANKGDEPKQTTDETASGADKTTGTNVTTMNLDKLYPNIPRPHLERKSKRSQLIDDILTFAATWGYDEPSLKTYLESTVDTSDLRKLKTDELRELLESMGKQSKDPDESVE